MAKHLSGGVEDLVHARIVRREDDLRATMSERLARLHVLCKQMSAIKGAARSH